MKKLNFNIYYPNLPYAEIFGTLLGLCLLGSMIAFIAGAFHGDKYKDCYITTPAEIVFYPTWGVGCYLLKPLKTDDNTIR